LSSCLVSFSSFVGFIKPDLENNVEKTN
jgi:hypothetical protein